VSDTSRPVAPNVTRVVTPVRDASDDGQRVIDARVLLGAARAVRIAHNGESYSLRITRLGKLILTK
jgi:hemin uptake protein HemP